MNTMSIKKGYTRVTEIISWLSAFWQVDPDLLDKRCLEGSQVHEAILADMLGDFYVLSGELQGFYRSYEKWKEIVNFELIEAEKRYYEDELKITGKIDALVKIGGKTYILDFKTSKTASLKTWQLQGAFYKRLVGEGIEPYVFFVQLKRDGSLPKVHKVDVEKYENLALHVYEIYKYMK